MNRIATTKALLKVSADLDKEGRFEASDLVFGLARRLFAYNENEYNHENLQDDYIRLLSDGEENPDNWAPVNPIDKRTPLEGLKVRDDRTHRFNGEFISLDEIRKRLQEATPEKVKQRAHPPRPFVGVAK